MGRANSRLMPRSTGEAFRALAWLSLGLVLWASFPYGHSEAHSLRAGDHGGHPVRLGTDLDPAPDDDHPGHPRAAVRHESRSSDDTVSADDHHREHSSRPLVESHPCSVCRSAEHHPCDRPTAQGFATAKAPTDPVDRRDPDLRGRIFAARHPARGPPTEART